jgi:hypothetical protein
MRNIAIIKRCSEEEKTFILSLIEREDQVLFFDTEK